VKYSVIIEPVDDGYALVARPVAGICPFCLHPTQFLERPREVKTRAGRIVSFELTFVEMAYDNVLLEARNALHGVRLEKPKGPPNRLAREGEQPARAKQ